MNRKLRKRLGAGFMALCMAFMVPLSVSAETVAEIQAEQDRLEQEKQELQAKLETLRDQEAEKQAYQETLQEQINLVQEQIDTTRENINTLKMCIRDSVLPAALAPANAPLELSPRATANM